MGVYYVGYGIMDSWDPEWLQGALHVSVGLVRMIGLADNVTKSKTMTCQTGAIILGVSQEAFGQRSTGEGATYR